MILKHLAPCEAAYGAVSHFFPIAKTNRVKRSSGSLNYHVRSHDFRTLLRLEVDTTPKQKSSAQIQVADGAGGMRQVVDLRFEAGEWPITLVVSVKEAENWMAHLTAETEERGWNSSAFSQLDASENSGTISVRTTSGPSSATIDIVWEKSRAKELRLRARPSGEPPLSIDDVQGFINAVNERARTEKMLRAHRRAFLMYDGLPWRGELWLDDNHRLGPPSKYPDTLLGTQIVVVDAMMDGIGQQGVTANFQRRLYELRVFLSFVFGLKIELNKSEQVWVYDVNSEGQIKDCMLRNTGYVELSSQTEFPAVGSAPPVARRDVARPGLGPYGIWPDMQEEWVPADIEQLWESFLRLPNPKSTQLLHAGNAYLIAQSMWPDQRTAYAAFLVVACEALKPTGRRYDRMNVYDVVASLVGVGDAAQLRRLSLHPQKVRSEHLHRGKLSAGELLPMLMHNHFMDPSFDEMLRILARVCRICLIEWLRREGKYEVIRLAREKHRTAPAIREFINRLLRRLRFVQ